MNGLSFAGEGADRVVRVMQCGNRPSTLPCSIYSEVLGPRSLQYLQHAIVRSRRNIPIAHKVEDFQGEEASA